MNNFMKRTMTAGLATLMSVTAMIPLASANDNKADGITGTAQTPIQAAAATNASAVTLDVTVPTMYAFVVSADYDANSTETDEAKKFSLNLYEPDAVTNANNGTVRHTGGSNNVLKNGSMLIKPNGDKKPINVNYTATVGVTGTADGANWALVSTAPAAAFQYQLGVNKGDGTYQFVDTTNGLTNGVLGKNATVQNALKVQLGDAVTPQDYFNAIKAVSKANANTDKTSTVSAPVATVNWTFTADVASGG